MAAIVSSCSDEITGYPGIEEEEDTSGKIRVGASVNAGVYSRGYLPSGTVSEGDFYFTYPSSRKSVIMGDTIYNYKVANVTFGQEGVETMGFVTYEDATDGKLKDLKWTDVTLRRGTPGTAVFYLDNVNPALNDASVGTDVEIVNFKEGEENPFRAGAFDEDNGTNDLLWGTAEAANFTKKIDFQLHHNMSRFRVILNVLPRGDNGSIVDLSHVADIKLTNIQHAAEYFERTTGNLILPVEPVLEDLQLVDINDETPNTGNIIWKSIVPDEDVKSDESQYRAQIYTSQDYVLPPQAINNDSQRPKLQVTVPAHYAGYNDDSGNVIFEAFLPQNMYVKDDDAEDSEEESTSNRRPMPLSFMKEHILIIRATIGPPEMKLEFAPVYVEEWVDMGEHSITGQQAGIYTNDDFMAFLDCYAKGDTVLLAKYGYRNGKDETGHSKWSIMFWSKSISLEKEGENGVGDYLKGKMHDEIPFSFSFNNYTIKVSGWDSYTELSGASGQILLYNWITGSELPAPGIESAEKFLDMITKYNSKSSSGMQLYGAYDNTNEKWIFEFTQTAPDVVELEFEDIHKAMNDETGAGNFSISFRGHTVRIKNVPGGGTIELEGEEGENLLHAILENPAGLYSLQDVEWLSRIYNYGQTSENGEELVSGIKPGDDVSWMLGLYGTQQSNGNWQFTFRRGMEFSGPSIYAIMIPDAEEGKPDYSFTKNPTTLAVKVGDTGPATSPYLYSPAVGDLKKLFAGSGSIANASNFSSMITYANNGNPIYRRYYGAFNYVTNQWEYPINGTFEIPYSTLSGKLTSVDPAIITMIAESKVTVTGMPDGAPDLVCRGQQGADILLQILRGIYSPDNIPEPGLETQGDFTNLFTAINSGNTENLKLYGNYDEGQGKWIIQFTPTAPQQIELKYNSVNNAVTANTDFDFNFGSRTVKLTGLPDGANDIVLSGEEGESLLKAIVTAVNGIGSQIDLDWLTSAYNANVAGFSMSPLSGNTQWILSAFGTKDGAGKWTFNFTGNMRLSGTSVYGIMTPDGTSAKPEYTFAYANGSSVQVYEGSLTETVTAQNLAKLFSNGGQIATSQDMTAMIGSIDNTIKSRYYGVPGNSSGSWAFPVTGSFTISYGSITGKLQGKGNIQFVMSTGITVTVNGLPYENDDLTCEGAEGAQLLLSVVSGEYQPKEPEPEPEEPGEEGGQTGGDTQG